MAPTLGETVHYVSYGTPGGEYVSTCRAAVVAEVGGWVTIASTPVPADEDDRPAREVTQWWYGDAVSLVVLNPEGLFFRSGGMPTRYRAPGIGPLAGGTWHPLSECPG